MDTTTPSPFGPLDSAQPRSGTSGWSRRGFLGVLGAVGVGTVVGCAGGGSDAQSVLAHPLSGHRATREVRLDPRVRPADRQPAAHASEALPAVVGLRAERGLLPGAEPQDRPGQGQGRRLQPNRRSGPRRLCCRTVWSSRCSATRPSPAAGRSSRCPDADDVIDMVAGVSTAAGSRPPVLKVCYVPRIPPRPADGGHPDPAGRIDHVRHQLRAVVGERRQPPDHRRRRWRPAGRRDRSVQRPRRRRRPSSGTSGTSRAATRARSAGP